MPTLLESNTAETFRPYAPVSVTAMSVTAARIPAYSTTTHISSAHRRDSSTRSPDRAQECLDLVWGRRTRIRACSRPLRDLGRDDAQLVLWDAERAKALEPAQACQLLDTGRRISDAERRRQRRNRVGHDRLVETQRGGEADCVERTVW